MPGLYMFAQRVGKLVFLRIVRSCRSGTKAFYVELSMATFWS